MFGKSYLDLRSRIQQSVVLLFHSVVSFDNRFHAADDEGKPERKKIIEMFHKQRGILGGKKKRKSNELS